MTAHTLTGRQEKEILWYQRRDALKAAAAWLALVGLPAGRLVDSLGCSRVMSAGLIGITVGAALMTMLPGWFGIGGYVGGLALTTAGYALFQAANNTAVMAGATKERRGLTSALLGLSRNLGLITGASAMGAVFALGSRGLVTFGGKAGPQSGLQVTFAVATILAGLALLITLRARPPVQPTATENPVAKGQLR